MWPIGEHASAEFLQAHRQLTAPMRGVYPRPEHRTHLQHCHAMQSREQPRESTRLPSPCSTRWASVIAGGCSVHMCSLECDKGLGEHCGKA